MNDLVKLVFKNNWDDIFITDSICNKSFSYSDFLSITLQYKSYLEALDIKHGEKVCLLMNNSFELVVMYFASLVMQLVVVPVDPGKSQHEINEILKISGCRKVFSNTSFSSGDIEIFDTNLIQENIFPDKKFDQKYLNIFDSIDFSALYLIAFTSGSTGVPKGVMHSFKNLLLSSLAFNKRLKFDKKNIFYHILPMTYMAGILNLIFLPFISGSKIVIGPRFDISRAMNFWDIPKKFSVNTFWFVPTILSLLLKLDKTDTGIGLFAKEYAIGCVGTAPLDPKIKEAFELKYKIALYESYGLSETLFVSTNYDACDKKRSVGILLDGVTVDFSQERELLIDVPWMFLGYSNTNSADNFDKNRFKSGDIGLIENDGFLTITDRKKDLIIKGGINISPAKINDHIRKLEILDEFVVTGVPDDVMGEKTVLFFVPGCKFEESCKKSINTSIAQEIGKIYCVDQFIQLDSIPKNLNGKIDKLKLKSILS